MLVLSSAAIDVGLKFSIENLSPATGSYLTPMWVGLHNRSFNLFSPGVAATPGLELLAEDGDASTLMGKLAMPSWIQMAIISTPDPITYPLMSFASMVIPSNDPFIGNGNIIAHRVFNNDGTFAGPLVINLSGADIWDAGTEENDTMDAAFSLVDRTSTDENGTVYPHPGLKISREYPQLPAWSE